MKMFQCDDGNLLDGDGCDKNCMIEQDFVCYGGNEMNADLCHYAKPPTIKRANYMSNRTLTIKFSTQLMTNCILI